MRAGRHVVLVAALIAGCGGQSGGAADRHEKRVTIEERLAPPPPVALPDPCRHPGEYARVVAAQLKAGGQKPSAEFRRELRRLARSGDHRVPHCASTQFTDTITRK